MVKTREPLIEIISPSKLKSTIAVFGNFLGAFGWTANDFILFFFQYRQTETNQINSMQMIVRFSKQRLIAGSLHELLKFAI